MKKKILMKLSATMVAMAIVVGSMSANSITASAAVEDYYTSDKESVSTPDGNNHKLYSYTENQTYGKLSGKSRKVKFYVYAKYVGNTKVESIKCSWKIGAKMRSSATVTATVGVTGNSYTASASSSSTWQNVTTEEKYWLHTSGTKVSYEDSNFVISPDCDLSGFNDWVTTTATVKLKGYAKKASISSTT
nr:hypothetical protein [Eubacterium sp.]